MPIYRYLALSTGGKKLKGIIDADDLLDARLKLETKKIIITSLKEVGSKKLNASFSKEELLIFTQELAKLLKAGLPLYETLLALQEKYEEQVSQSILMDLCDQIKMGKNLSQALIKHPKSFDHLYCSIIESAEKSGSLTEALQELISLLSRQQVLKKQLTSALTYPALLTCFALFVLSSLFFYVIPSLYELFEGRKLHFLTELILSISMWVNAKKTFLLFSILSTITFGVICYVFRWGKEFFTGIFFKIPFIKHLLIKVDMIRFCRCFSTLLKGGVSFVEALELSKNIVKHPDIQQSISTAQKKVMEGRKLSDGLSLCPFIPRLFIRMLSVAEQGGEVPIMLSYIGNIYEEELEKNLSKISTLLQPLILIFLGFVVGFIVLAVLLPLTDVSSFITEG